MQPLRHLSDLPRLPHPGAFGAIRKHHIHEGIDLYGNDGDAVYTMDEGTVIAVYPFTGPSVGMPWWNDTWAVAVEDVAGVWVYGELVPTVCAGSTLKRGDTIGHLTPVLKVDKGRPMTMLHLERWKKGYVPYTFLWQLNQPQPPFLLDPSRPLIDAICRYHQDTK